LTHTVHGCVVFEPLATYMILYWSTVNRRKARLCRRSLSWERCICCYIPEKVIASLANEILPKWMHL